MLEIKNLKVELKNEGNEFYILRNVNLTLGNGEILGLAGESGSGKSVMAKTILGITSKPIEKTGGLVVIDGNVLTTEKDFAAVRGKKISMIFQNPSGSLNPVMTIGAQLSETVRLFDKKISRKDALKKSEELLQSVEIDMPKDRLGAYPHQLSGGMNQRVMIALALAANPDIIIADEPTTALDVTIQEQIIKLLYKLNKDKNLSILFISHDLSLLERICGKIAVLYSGELMEVLTAEALRENQPHHPYTKALKSCIPEIGVKKSLTTIKGSIGRNDSTKDSMCIFADRCSFAYEKCFKEKPAFNGSFACHKPFLYGEKQ